MPSLVTEGLRRAGRLGVRLAGAAFPLGSRAIGRLRGRAEGSLRRRIAGAFLLLALASGAAFSLSATLAYDYTITHVIRWHMDPIMRLLIDAEENRPESVRALAKTLRVKWYAGDAIPDDLRPESRGRELVRIERDRYAMTCRTKEGREYAVVGKVKDLDDLEEAMRDVALACVLGSLLAAGLLALWLGRRLITPLVELARKVKAGEPLDDAPLCARKDEVGALARAFAGRERELRAFLNREQLFTGDVSHELRTPLTVLRGGAEILESRLEDRPDLLPVVERMHRTLAAMTATVSALLLLARAPERLECRPFDLAATARREGDMARELLRGRPIAFDERLPDVLMAEGNPEVAALVLHNLLDNACRYTEEGRIELTLDADGLVLTDTAPSIDPEVRARMFERGTRGASRTPGSGLGLSLVQRGCERLGWRVSHEPWEGGNRFRVRFTA